jgi:hypothetical protein
MRALGEKTRSATASLRRRLSLFAFRLEAVSLAASPIHNQMYEPHRRGSPFFESIGRANAVE